MPRRYVGLELKIIDIKFGHVEMRQTQTADLQTGRLTRKSLLWNALTESLSLKFKSFKSLV